MTKMNDEICELAIAPEQWFIHLATGDVLEVLAHGYRIDADRWTFSLLFRGQPNVDVSVLTVPSALVAEKHEKNFSAQYFDDQYLDEVDYGEEKVYEDAEELVSPPQRWTVELTTGDNLVILANDRRVEGDRCIFSLLFRGEPNFFVTCLSLPAALVDHASRISEE